MLIGYARISTAEQSLNLQIDELKGAGCIKIFEDVASGANDNRSGLEQAISFARLGDCLVTWKLDRLGRSLRHLIEVVNRLSNAGVGFKSISEALDTTTPSGKLTFHLFGALGEFERSLIQERTCAGLKAARARGRIGGRPKKLGKPEIDLAERLFKSGELSSREISKSLGVSRATLYRNVVLK